MRRCARARTGARRRGVCDRVRGGAVRSRHELVPRDEGHTGEQLVPRARRRGRAQPAPRRVRRDRQPCEGRGRIGDPEPERDARLSRDDGSRGAAALAMSGGRGVTYAGGFRAGAAKAGVKHGRPERLDVALIVSERPCVAAAVFTTNQVIAAPCVVTRRHVERGPLRAIVVNSGNANACTGEQGERDAIAMAEAAAEKIGCDPHEVAVASTGVIGVPLPVGRITAAIRSIELRTDAWDDVAKAMMTTDTRPKLARNDFPLVWRGASGTVHVRAVAKGAGMIHP